MASFTDQIMQFNPYVKQLPTEAMTQVGMYKQQKYEEGVQKIQSYIDNIAGLDVYKPLHKQYLQSKLNELGGKLKTVAAGDFSNFQLVNSVGGMATQIVKDPTVQNAVASTQKIRKQQENIETARKAGKSSPDNEDYYADQLNSWLNDGKLETKFNGEFIEYRDVDSKLRDLTSKLKEDEIGIENPYMRDDATGKTLYFYKDPKTGKEVASLDPSKGEKKLDLDMLYIKVKGVSAQKILNNFYNSLDANDIRQMKINSWAHYRGAGPEYFKSDIETAYKNKKEILSEEMVDLALKLQNPKITGIDKAKIETRISEINSSIENRTLDKELAEDLLELENPKNLEEYKYKLYTQTYLTNLARDLSYRSYIQERKANPAEQADMARKNFQFNQIQEANKNYWLKKNYDLEVDKETYKRRRDTLEDYAKQVEKGYKVVPGAWKTGMEPPTIEDLGKTMTSSAEQFNTEFDSVAQTLYPSSDPNFKNFTIDQKREALRNDLKEYRKNPYKSLTPDQKEYFELLKNMEDGVSKNVNAWISAKEFKDNFKKDYVNKKTQNQTVTVGGNTFTGEDVLDFNSNMEKFTKTQYPSSGAGPGVNPAPVTTFDDDAALAFYQTYKGGKLLPMFKSYMQDYKTFAIMSADDKKLMKFNKDVTSATADVDKKADEATSHYIATVSPVYAVQRAAINTKDPIKAATLKEFLAVKAAEAGEVGELDTRNPGDYNQATVGKYQGDEDTGWVIEKGKDGSANVVMFAKDGTTQIIPATAEQIATYFPEVAVVSPFQDIKDTIATSKGRTTNSANQRFVPGSGATAVNATITGYSKAYLPQLKGTGYESKVRIDVEGFSRNIGNPKTDKYAVVMYVPDPKTGMWKGDYLTGEDGGSYVSEADVTTVLSMISPYTIDQAIKRFK